MTREVALLFTNSICDNRVSWWRAGQPTVDTAGGAPRPKDSHPGECAKSVILKIKWRRFLNAI